MLADRSKYWVPHSIPTLFVEIGGSNSVQNWIGLPCIANWNDSTHKKKCIPPPSSYSFHCIATIKSRGSKKKEERGTNRIIHMWNRWTHKVLQCCSIALHYFFGGILSFVFITSALATYTFDFLKWRKSPFLFPTYSLGDSRERQQEEICLRCAVPVWCGRLILLKIKWLILFPFPFLSLLFCIEIHIWRFY